MTFVKYLIHGWAAKAAFTVVMMAGPAQGAISTGAFYERALMRTAGERCRLFSPDIAAALVASSLQARGAALRAGASTADLADVEQRASLRAYGVDCASPDLATAAMRVRKGFEGYARLSSMRFPGDVAGWQAERVRAFVPTQTVKVAPGPRWRLAQTAPLPADMVFGIVDGPGPVAVTSDPLAVRASYARLVMRDPRKAPAPYLDARKPGLSGRIAPRAVSTAIFASGKTAAPATLLPGGQTGVGQKTGVMFSFPPAAAEALASLDPREAVVVEFVSVGASGEQVGQAWVEVGDFAAARAFLAATR